MSLKKWSAVCLTLAGFQSDPVWKTLVGTKTLVSTFLELYFN